jgi:hypothetical protein
MRTEEDMNDDTTESGAVAEGKERWAAARTLADLGELTAQWLEGRLPYNPAYGNPAPETSGLIPVLAAANRAGFVNHQSQPGEPLDEQGSAQRANVSGYCTPEGFARLMAAASGADLIITAARALDASEERKFGPFFTITLDAGEEFTWDGIALSRSILDDSYGWDCHPAAVDELFSAWQVTLIDPVWGRNDVLWPVLQAFADSAEHMTDAHGGAST